MLRLNQLGAAPLLILLSIVGLVGFIAITQNVFYKENSKLGTIYKKSESFAKSPYNPGDTDGDLDVDIFDYNTVLANFGKSFTNADFNDNTIVDIFDYNTVLANFGIKYPSSTPSPSPQALINGVSVCTNHDSNTWHELVIRNPDGSINCTYGHHHGDDPRTVDGLFGQIGTWWGAPGDAYGYPWVTSAAENTAKHNLFKNIVRINIPPSASTDIFGKGVYIKNFRSWTHSLGSGGHIPGYTAKDGFQTQVHSFAVEAEICDVAGCGKLRIGGHQDIGYGVLEMKQSDGSCKDTCVLPNQFLSGTCAQQEQQSSTRHIHGTSQCNRRDFTWYAATAPNYKKKTGNGVLGDGTNVDFGVIQGCAWANVNPNDYDELNFVSVDQCNSSRISQEILGFRFDPWDPGVSNGRVNFHGYTDNWGNVYQDLTTCQANTNPVICVPFDVTNVPVGSPIYRDSDNPNAGNKDHDVKVTVNGVQKSLTSYPN